MFLLGSFKLNKFFWFYFFYEVFPYEKKHLKCLCLCL